MSNSPILHTDILVVGQQRLTPAEYCTAGAAAVSGGIGILAGPVFIGQPVTLTPTSLVNIVTSPVSAPGANALTISADGLGATPYPGNGIIANAASGHAIISTLSSGILVTPSSVTVLTNTFNIITNEIHIGLKNHTGASSQNGVHSQNGASTKAGAKADVGARAEAGAAAQNAAVIAAGPVTSPNIAAIEARLSAVAALAGKGFDIPHPTKEEHRLRYICLEGPEVGAYIRGTLKDSDTIELPDYWRTLCKPETITVNLTPIGRYQELYVEEVVEWGTKIKVRNASGSSVHCHYTVFAERVTNDNLQVEYKGLTPDDYPGDNSEYALGGWDYARHKGESKTSDL